MPSPEATRRRATLSAAILTEAVLRLERTGPLEDSAELQQAFRTRPTRAAQLQERARLLGVRLGLLRELARWRRMLLLAVAVLAIAMALLALATVRALLGPDRSINVVAAFISLLGWHGATLVLWLLGFLRPWRARSGRLSLARAALWLVAQVPAGGGHAGGRTRHGPLLLQSTMAVLRRARLWPWLTGVLSHTIWALSFVVVLGVLWLRFAFQEYRLTWETTILSAGFFERFVAVTGVLPARLGFAVPDAAAVLQAGSAGTAALAASQSAWAQWLLGCVTAYGLLPRALLALLSIWRWRAGQARVAQPDMVDAAVRGIMARLDALEPASQVIDPEQRADGPGLAGRMPAVPGSDALVVVGFELPPEVSWPPPDLPASAVTLSVSGSAAERRAASTRLAAIRPMALLVQVHATSSPDRGTARFLRDATTFAGRSAVWLRAPDGPVPRQAAQRWRDWLRAEGFAACALLQDAAAVRDWMASAHG